MEKEIGADLANNIRFFGHLFGPYPYKKLLATEIPYSHGEAFSGLLHLSWATFLKTDDRGLSVAFRAHEVAHQWWGATIDWSTYHDQWLSEGFAEYSGLWYVQAAMKDDKKFFEILDDWKDEILATRKSRKSVFSSGVEAGPISLGYRTSTSKTSGDYSLIIS